MEKLQFLKTLKAKIKASPSSESSMSFPAEAVLEIKLFHAEMGKYIFVLVKTGNRGEFLGGFRHREKLK